MVRTRLIIIYIDSGSTEHWNLGRMDSETAKAQAEAHMQARGLKQWVYRPVVEYGQRIALVLVKP